MTDITVSSHRIIHRTPDILPGSQRKFLCFSINIRFNELLYIGAHLMSHGIDDFNSIIIKRIVAGRNHNSAVKLFRPHHIRNTWRRRHMQQVSIGSAGRKSGRQRIFKHITGTPCVFSNNNPCFVFFPKIIS